MACTHPDLSICYRWYAPTRRHSGKPNSIDFALRLNKNQPFEARAGFGENERFANLSHYYAKRIVSRKRRVCQTASAPFLQSPHPRAQVWKMSRIRSASRASPPRPQKNPLNWQLLGRKGFALERSHSGPKHTKVARRL